MENIKYNIVQVSESNKEKLFRLLNWRKTGIESDDIEEVIEHGELNTDYFKIYAAEVENKYIGYITIAIIPKPDSRIGTLYVDELWVPEQYRRNGIAKSLMFKAYEYAREKGLWKVRLVVGDENITAREFYKNVGFNESTAMFCEKVVEE